MLKYHKGQNHLYAISWAARQAGMTYGEFVVDLTPERCASILLEYVEMKRKKAAELEEQIRSKAIRRRKPREA